MTVSKLLFILRLALACGTARELVAISLEEDLSLTLPQKRALDKFREQVGPLLTTDFMKRDIYLIRWLRARNFDLNGAEAMLKENLRWRQENKIDQILTEDFQDMSRDFPSTLDTSDREGRPIIDIGEWNIRDAVVSGRGPRLLRFMDMIMENVSMQIFERQQRGLNVSQDKVLGNAESFNMVTHGCPICIPLWAHLLGSLENHYQGWLDEFIIIEANAAVYTMLNVLRPFLSSSTRDPLKIFGMNRAVWMPYLDARIAREERRPRYGGTKPPVDRQ